MQEHKFNKVINKLFFRKSIFKFWCIACYFISLILFIWGMFSIRSPYDYYVESRNYSNLIEFVDKEYATPILSDNLFDSHRYEYQHVFLEQAKRKGIIISHSDNARDSSMWMTLAVYSCDTSRLNDFLEKYQKAQTLGNLSQRLVTNIDDAVLDIRFIVGLQYESIQIDCNKAKTVPLKTDSYYITRDLLGGCLITVPICLMLIWLFFRFAIIAPVLWLLKKDKK